MTLIVDGNNVMGSRPDGWWRDRPAAARRLAEAIAAWAQREARDDVVVVFDGREPAAFPALGGVEVRFAGRTGPGAADDVIAALASAATAPVTVVTSDRGLAARVRAAGARVQGARRFRDALGPAA